MSYTNSPMVSYTKLSPNHSGQRTHSIDRITPHCVVGQCSVETLGRIFTPTSKQASSNYGIGLDGRVGMYVEEKNRSWCSSSNANDQRAVTIECASDSTEPYAFKDVVYQTLIKLCVDICQRNGKTKLLWLGDKDKTLNYAPKANEMILTVHRWFANKSCPGNWMYAHYPYHPQRHQEGRRRAHPVRRDLLQRQGRPELGSRQAVDRPRGQRRPRRHRQERGRQERHLQPDQRQIPVRRGRDGYTDAQLQRVPGEDHR